MMTISLNGQELNSMNMLIKFVESTIIEPQSLELENRFLKSTRTKVFALKLLSLKEWTFLLKKAQDRSQLGNVHSPHRFSQRMSLKFR